MRRGLADAIAQAHAVEARRWAWWGGFSVNVEEAEFLYALVRAAKPPYVVESGSGRSTQFLAAAVEDNGIGRLESHECDYGWAKYARNMLGESDVATIHLAALPPPQSFVPEPDMVFLDSCGDILRPDEIRRWSAREVLLVIHDSYRYPECDDTGFTLRTPRGLWVRDRRPT